MPTITYNGQSFALDGRRLWLLGATMHYARIPADRWTERIRAVRDAGFNTVEAVCPWFVHEPKPDRFTFSGRADLRLFVETCHAHGLRVILRLGPFVTGGYDGGGIPAWLAAERPARVRVREEVFFDRTSRHLHALIDQVSDLQATTGGPIVAVQVEDAWECDNEAQAETYLHELVRIVREAGIAVPVLNANNLWVDGGATIDVWRGRDEMLANLRQLAELQPDAPRLVRLDAADPAALGAAAPAPVPADHLLAQFAQALSAGAQPIVSPFHAGTNLGFLAGRPTGAVDVAVGPAAVAPPLGEVGARGPTYDRLKRIATFANHFGALFAELDLSFRPITAEPPAPTNAKGADGLAVVPLRGGGGQAVFVFASRPGAALRLLLDNGTHLPIDLGDQPVGWYLIDADLQGRGRLDYANLCPFAFIDRRMLVLYGPAKREALVSVNGTPMSATVPNGAEPLVVEHKGIRIVICNEAQIDAAIATRTALVLGAEATAADGSPVHPKRGALTIPAVGEVQKLAGDGRPAAPRPIKLGDWLRADLDDYAEGTAPRYAILPGPASLPACGAAQGYGWYRLIVKSTAAKTRKLLPVGAGGRVHWFVGGAPSAFTGDGLDGTAGPLSLKCGKGETHVVALVENPGRWAGGTGGAARLGLFDAIHEVTAVAARPKRVDADPVEPLSVEPFVEGLSIGQKSSIEQIEWSFTYGRKAPLIVVADGLPVPGTLVLNGVPLRRLVGPEAGGRTIVLLDPQTETAFGKSKQVLRFAPDPGVACDLRAIGAAVKLFASAGDLGAHARWGFAKWGPPLAARYEPSGSGSRAPKRGVPRWWKTTFTAPDTEGALWLELAGLSRGVVLIDDAVAGRFALQSATGKKIGLVKRVLLPSDLLRPGTVQSIQIFDEHGFAPGACRIVADEKGELD